MFIRSIERVAPFKVLELCIIWFQIGVENNLSMSNFIACLENENIIKGLHPLAFPSLEDSSRCDCLSGFFIWDDWIFQVLTDRQNYHACVSVSVCLYLCDVIWVDWWLTTRAITTLSRTVTETARTQEGKPHGGRGLGVGRSGSGRLNCVMNALSKLLRNFANRATFLKCTARKV